jgi:RNA polymerase-binding transcription factor DksA
MRSTDPAWRALLEAQWRARLQEVTELSLAYHEAAAASAAAPADRRGERKLRQLMRRAVAARRALADTDEALARLAEGRYGRCEGCAAAIGARLLAAAPDARYCPRCRPVPFPLPPSGGTGRRPLADTRKLSATRSGRRSATQSGRRWTASVRA